jgi:hypothetical protein
MKAGRSDSLGAGSKEWELVAWSGLAQCSRLAWSRTVSLHSPPYYDGCLTIWSYSSVGPTTWGPLRRMGTCLLGWSGAV